MIISLISLLTLVNAVTRIKRCALGGDLAISKNQMRWHIGSFASFAIANIFWLTVQAIQFSNLRLDDVIGFSLMLLWPLKVSLYFASVFLRCRFFTYSTLLSITGSSTEKKTNNNRSNLIMSNLHKAIAKFSHLEKYLYRMTKMNMLKTKRGIFLLQTSIRQSNCRI